MNKPAFIPCVMLVLALIGLADTLYDSYSVHTGHLLWCPAPFDGCNTVARSPYARIFGIPLGYLGVVFYSGLLALGALLAFGRPSRRLSLAALVYAALGVPAPVLFVYVQFALIHAFCIYCLGSGVVTILFFLAALAHFRAGRPAALVPAFG